MTSSNLSAVRAHKKTRRIAILGGGPSSLVCAYNLTSSPQLREQFDVSVYTMGWRLGGKGASGRGEFDRIQEHGLHILFGAYHTFFRLMRDCYEELGRSPEQPLATWRDAFKPHDFGVVEDFSKDRWHRWPLVFPRNAAQPGDPGTVLMGTGEYIGMVVQSLITTVFGWRIGYGMNQKIGEHLAPIRDSKPDFLTDAALNILDRLLVLAHDISDDMELGRHRLLSAIEQLRKHIWGAIKVLSQLNEEAHRFWLGADFFTAFLIGFIKDGLYDRSNYPAIDNFDFREWLEKHGAHPLSLEGPWGRTIYDAAFSYVGGNPKDQKISAAVAVHLLIGFAMYRGSMYYKMQAGMGDSVFAPLYEVLKRRGVSFHFFHKVENLHLDEDHRRIAAVSLTRQAESSVNNGQYQPLVDVAGLPCWPAEPRYEQLRNGDALKGVDLESYYQISPHETPVRLECGKDFDEIVFGIPVGAVPGVCRELLEVRRQWRDMSSNVLSVQTVAFQVWTKQDLESMGWNMPAPLLSLYVEPLNTWADMSQVLWSEHWPRQLTPATVQYFAGPQLGPKFAPPREESPDFEKQQNYEAKKLAIEFMGQGWTNLMPKTRTAGVGRAEFDWNVLVDPHNGAGETRFDAQYWRSNCGPSERCTIAQPGSMRYRMAAGDTGFENLTVTGDWIDNGIYAACMEGAFNSGILSARAVSGIPFEVDSFWYSGTTGAPSKQDLKHRISIPQDDGLIDNTPVQWWYWSGHVASHSGREFGIDLVYFVVEGMKDLIADTNGQAAITDVQNAAFHARETNVFGRPEKLANRFRLVNDDATMTAEGGEGNDHLHFEVDGYVVDLHATAIGQVEMHYGGRLHEYTFGGNTYYYSRPLMAAQGTVRTPDGEVHQVEGRLWFDRQWGDLMQAMIVGWQWFPIQLDDGTTIMVVAFNHFEQEWLAQIRSKDGRTQTLDASEFHLEILDWWTSPTSGRDYPHGWRLSLAAYDLEIRPLVADQEMPGAYVFGPPYWEGLCAVSGNTSGRAYAELGGFSSFRSEPEQPN